SADRGVAVRGAHADEEGLVELAQSIAVRQDRDVLAGRLARLESPTNRDGRIVASGGRGAVRGRVVDGHGLVVGNREADGERERGCARVPYQHRRVGDADARLVILDGDGGLAVGDPGPRRGTVELNEEILVRL